MTKADKRDGALGALLGLAVGDAVGTTLEFRPRDRTHVADMTGGGPVDLLPGEWTDDTSVAFCLADSLLAERRLDLPDFARRLSRWYRDGENSMTAADSTSAAPPALPWRPGCATAASSATPPLTPPATAR